MLYLPKNLKITHDGGLQMSENTYKFKLAKEARVDISGSLLIADAVCIKNVKCDWFKRFAPKSPYDSASTTGALGLLREKAHLDDHLNGSTVSTLTARQVARLTNKVEHYQDISRRIEEASANPCFLAPPRMVQGQHGVYFRIGRPDNKYQVIEERNGYSILFSEVPHDRIYNELLVKSGMVMVADGKKDWNLEKGVDHSSVQRIPVPKGTYVCHFSKDGLKLRIKKD